MAYLPAPQRLRLSDDHDDPVAADVTRRITRRLADVGALPVKGSATSALLPDELVGVITTPAVDRDGTQWLVVTGVTVLLPVGEDRDTLVACRAAAHTISANVVGFHVRCLAGHLVASTDVTVPYDHADDTWIELASRVLRDLYCQAATLRTKGGSWAPPDPHRMRRVTEAMRLQAGFDGSAYTVADTWAACQQYVAGLPAPLRPHVDVQALPNGTRMRLPLAGAHGAAARVDLLTIALPEHGTGIAVAADFPSRLPATLAGEYARGLNEDHVSSDEVPHTTPWRLGTWAVRSAAGPDGSVPVSFHGFVPDTYKPYCDLVDVTTGVATQTWSAWYRYAATGGF